MRKPRRPGRRRDHLHLDAEQPRWDRVRLHGDPPRHRALPDRHRHRVRPARSCVDPPARARAVTVEDVTSAYACLGLWGPKAREILQPLTTTPLDFGYMRSRELAIGNVPCLALRVTYVGELGWELYCPMEFGLALVGRDLGAGPRARPRCGRLQGDRLAAAREGLPRLGLRHHARRHAVRGRPGVRGEARQGRLQRPRGPARGAGARAPAPLPRARRSARCRARLRAGAGGRRGRRARHERRLRLLGRALDRLRLPAGSERRAGQPVEVEIFGEWVAGEVAAEPLFDPAGERIRG